MALYRKYRPASFAEVVGQEHVTAPLSRALDSGRINHAYLFSGPRGCGKTSSARIMARSLNCAEGPTSTPCGRCPSCVSLAPGGPGNLDVTELDAASHRGVEDMRELRDRAYYAPAESRYRVFIIDEAHMITTEGSNALLKIVEEPPEHLIFIFATTEPEKVINTIRSRTHHYPFRLLTPLAMRGLLERTVAAESAQVEESVYPLVIRAGGGSPRDSLSILDQLLAGAGENGLTYEQAVALLGMTSDALIDATITSLASSDYASLFGTIDDVIEGGFEPRQFALDLLNRLRDLMVIRTVTGAVEHGLVDAPTGREAVLAEQANSFSPAQLARMAALTNDGLTDMRGATSARLLLEVMCAKLLLPADANGASGVHGDSGTAGEVGTASARGGTAPAGASREGTSAAPQPRFERKSVRLKREQEEAARRQAEEKRQIEQERSVEAQRQAEQDRSAEEQRRVEAQRGKEPQAEQRPVVVEPAAEPGRNEPQPAEPQRAEPQPAPRTNAQESAEPRARQSSKPETAIADAWDEIRAEIYKASSRTGVMVAQAQVLEESPGSVTLGHNTGALASRLSAEEHRSTIATAIHEVTGKKVEVSCVIGGAVRRQSRDRAAHESAGKNDRQAEQHEDSDPEPGKARGEEAEQQPAKPQKAEPQPAETQPAKPQKAEPQPAETQPAKPQSAGEPTGSRWSGWQAPQLPPEPETSTPARRRPQAQSLPRTFERSRRTAEDHREPRRQRVSAPAQDEVPLPPEPAPEDAAPDTEFPPYPPEDISPEPRQPTGQPTGQPTRQPTGQSIGQEPSQSAAQPAGQDSRARARGGAGAPQGAGQEQSQEEIEEDFARQAAEDSGEVDRRDQKTVAIELLQEQLGAKLL